MKLSKYMMIGFMLTQIWLIQPVIGNETAAIDPQLRALQSPLRNGSPSWLPSSLSKTNHEISIPVLIKLKQSTEFQTLPFKPQAVIGDIVTATVSTSQLFSLVSLSSIEYVQASRMYKPLLDVSIPEINVRPVYQEYNVTGQGVLIGIIDTGIDWRHADFRNADGTTRIKYLLDFSDPGDLDGNGGLDGTGPYGGTLYTEQDINSALSGTGSIAETDLVGHGTHVAGCAAGNGRATGNGLPAETYVGVAPEADLVIVKATRVSGSNNFVSTDYINALAFVDSIANVLAQPYIVNMSLGGNEGAHDGTSLEEQAIDNLVGSGVHGKAVVVAAGNDGESAIHASGTLSTAKTMIESRFRIPANYTPNPDTQNDYVLFELWYDGSASMSVKLIAPNGTAYGPVVKGLERSDRSNNGAYYISNAPDGINPFNRDNQAIIQLFDYEAANPPASGEWKLQVAGTSGRFDVWMTTSSMGAEFTTNVDQTMIVATPGTAKNAITVGSYTTKNRWTDLDGRTIQPSPIPTIDAASGFSSAGPSRDGRVKPEISAPGEMITSSMASQAPVSSEYSIFNSHNSSAQNALVATDGVHGYSQGTSFAAPHVAGVIALIFQTNPSFDVIQIKQALVNGAKQDNFTTDMNKTGYGKLDAYETMKELAGDGPGDLFSVSLFQNSALTQYLEVYLIALTNVSGAPTATIKVDNNSATNVQLTQVESQIYKGSYQFTNAGNAVLSFTAKPTNGDQITFKEYFSIVLLKPSVPGTIQFEQSELVLGLNSVKSQAFIAVSNAREQAIPDQWQALQAPVQLGPNAFTLNKSAQLFMDIPNESFIDADKQITICYLNDGNWQQLPTKINMTNNKAQATVNKLGTFQLFAIPSDDVPIAVPQQSKLLPSYPNPFNARTTISYQLAADGIIDITIINISGATVRHLVSAFQTAGIHSIIWDGTDNRGQLAPSGLYFCKIKTHGWSDIGKMVMVK